jgi:triacylglycerol lipase
MIPPLLQHVCPHLSELCGEQYVAQLQEVLAITGAKKLNLIGHSHGVHAVCYAASVMPKRIVSVLTVGGANQGTVLHLM